MYNLSVELNQIILTTKKILEGSHGSTVMSSSDIPSFNFPWLVGNRGPFAVSDSTFDISSHDCKNNNQIGS